MIDETYNLEIKPEVPAYSEFLYGNIYNNLTASSEKDTKVGARRRTFLQYEKLVASTLREVKMNQRVLQMGLTFGDELDQVAGRIGAYGQFDVIDVNALQVERNKEKYGFMFPGMNIYCHDAANFTTQNPYDVVICFLLLQELPVVTKMKVINNALNAVKEGGSVVFVDYHNPIKWHPLRYVVRMYNRLHHPFAEKLWDRDIDTFAKHKTDFVWRKSTFFGRMFQKLVATRKISPLTENKQAEKEAAERAEYMLPDF